MPVRDHRGEEFALPGDSGGERREIWENLISATHADMSVRLDECEDGREFDGAIRRQWINDLALVDCVCDHCSGTRTRSRVAASTVDHVAILFNLGGREVVSQGERQKELHPGDAVVWDTRSALRFAVRERLVKRTLIVPRAALSEVGGRSWDMAGISLDEKSPAVRLLRGYLDLLAATVDGMGPAEVSAARNAALELFVGAVRPNVDPCASVTATPALRAQIEGWVNRNLFDGDITPAAIAAAHGVSVRTVHRVFSSDGESLSAYVRTRRLARACQELTGQRSVPISAIGRRLGFTDSSHFTRAFKARYGVSPREYRTEAGIWH